MSEFTPGPWDLLEVGDKCKHLCPSHDNLSILTVSLEYNDDDGEPTYFGSVYNPDDARLISAAPDMYGAIKAALCDDPDWRRLCVDALAKAEGRTT